ncbi:MAG: hypothetical protein WDN27_07165 [Candidatus Saccharibacteria bacterium]
MKRLLRPGLGIDKMQKHFLRLRIGSNHWSLSRKKKVIFTGLSVFLTLGGLFAWQTLPSQADYIQQGSLTGYWPMNEATGTAAADASGFGNDGAFSGSPTHVADVPSAISDFSGSSLAFIGSR